ncbi:MAG: DNA mismatch repair endonuclease MutL [Deltaproteobacteria bacterium]|nr:DNA mismatch repair endonuclease MutL [Deltaproteobacteria bacterium]
MGAIHVLDSAVADQIAAGEVVERPASVVKELIENALDAGARQVDVHVQGGGLERITVVDDGGGMAADDAVLCFSRHATSKLRVADDLRRLHTFGFRGEALAAIASVAKVTLTTRPSSTQAAHQVQVEGGRVTKVGEAGAPPGTRVDVDELFFNTPARKKFLKAARTEAGYIEDAVASGALSLPSVGFRLVVDGKTALDLPAAPEGAAPEHPLRVERAVGCLGKHVRPLLYPFVAAAELLTLAGHVVAPLETRRDLAGVHVSVNRRPVTDRGLVMAVRTAFRTLLEVGRQPIVALDVTIDPELVDVNVHPRKAEVRFADPRGVHGQIISLLSDFLARTPWLKSAPPARVFTLPSQATSAAFTPVTAPPAVSTWSRAAPMVAPGALGARGLPLPSAGTGSAASFSSLRVVGQVGGTYLVLDGPDGMVLIDQHAAHERVVFERLRARRSQEDAPSQPLLVPLQLELTSLELAALDDDAARALLERHGLVLEPFGPRTALIKALPPGLSAKRAELIARDALAELARQGSAGALDDRLDALCARLACHAAVRAGDTLSPDGVRALLRDLDAIDLGAHCPHGRPVVRTLRFHELAGWFDRR